ncbi:hypothetical protein GDO81_013310 [Engystomops pustulosus]|uniref:Cytochrome b n=1 Tax=Engystomops pustulosus TaxID=76066 RepID=A0AAV7B2K5_ENGPU|nr:hypothetical protein GDO81_013310 [Engystomops pustulosus]
MNALHKLIKKVSLALFQLGFSQDHIYIEHILNLGHTVACRGPIDGPIIWYIHGVIPLLLLPGPPLPHQMLVVTAWLTATSDDRRHPITNMPDR